MTLTSTTETKGVHGSPKKCDVCVVGAGPAGVMLATLLARFGIHVQIMDDRPDQTTVGRADGLQPKTIETFQMLRLGNDLLDSGVKVFDICMWSSEGGSQRRVGREVHYPPDAVDVLHPFILLCHQGMVEGMFVEDLRQSGVQVHRGTKFDAFCYETSEHMQHHGEAHLEEGAAIQATFGKVRTTTEGGGTQEEATSIVHTDYLVGCDGARSRVRQGIPDSYAEGSPHDSYWGVLDGELDTDFPDIWSKTVVYSEEHGSVLIIPRERNLTRFYIEVKNQQNAIDETFVMEQARKVLAPYRLNWLSVEWFGNYRVTQRVAARFTDAPADGTRPPRVFIAGDASHTHSPKAAQGMNTSMHDSWNLGWKLNLAVRGLARKDVLLASYESERKKIAHDLINFDYEHANSIAGGDAHALAENFRTNIGFISGVGAQYEENALNLAVLPSVVAGKTGKAQPCEGAAQPGRNLPPAKVTRYIDDNPVDVQLDIPMLGQFRIFIVAPHLVQASGFLSSFSEAVLSGSSLIARLSIAAQKSYQHKPRPNRPKDTYYRPERYLSLSELFTFGLITSTDKNSFELTSLPPVLSQSKWTVYLDNVPHLDTQGRKCTDKWLGGLGDEEVALVHVRPDGYVGSIMRFDTLDQGAGQQAAQSLDAYYGGFLEVS